MRQVCRLLAALLAGAVISGAVSAQTVDKVQRLDLLQTRADVHAVTLAELGRQGFVEGRNLVVETRTGTREQLPELARELVDLKPDVIVAGAVAIAAARTATNTIPLALEAPLPTVCEWVDMAREGCLIGYGPIPRELRLRAADYVMQIFRGASPGELPIEGPTRFKFAVNLKTAAALDLTLPQIVLLRADEVIE